MSSQTPAVGRIVHYRLSEEAAQLINGRRVVGTPILPGGTQYHFGNPAEAGQTFPMLIVNASVIGMVNGQVFLDGNDVYWAKEVSEGVGVGEFSWPPRV